MNIIKHLIITRFMCDNFIKKDTNINVQSDEWKEMSFDIAKRHIIPTLENQTNKNFTLVFLVGNNCNYDDVERIYALSDVIDIDVCYLQNFKAFIETREEDYLITSRLDYDDHVYNKCVEDIQNYVIKNKPSVKIYGLSEGVSLVDGESDTYLCYHYPWLKDEGCPAPMTTLILNRNAVYSYFDIYKLGYHTEVVKNLMAVQSYYLKDIFNSIDEIYYHRKGFDIDYIWLRHPHSATQIVDNVVHTTNIKIDLSKEQLKKIFGYNC